MGGRQWEDYKYTFSIFPAPVRTIISVQEDICVDNYQFPQVNIINTDRYIQYSRFAYQQCITVRLTLTNGLSHGHCKSSQALQTCLTGFDNFQASIEYPRRLFGYALVSFMVYLKTYRLLVTFQQVLNVLMGDAIPDAVYTKCHQNINCI